MAQIIELKAEMTHEKLIHSINKNFQVLNSSLTEVTAALRDQFDFDRDISKVIKASFLNISREFKKIRTELKVRDNTFISEVDEMNRKIEKIIGSIP